MDDYNSTESRYQRELARGHIDGDTFITATGAEVPMFKPQDDDAVLVTPDCVYCQGEGETYSDDEWGSAWVCYACEGTGKSNYQAPQGELRKHDWLDMVFYQDAMRAEDISRDICPECKAGGCGGECQFTAEDWAEIDGVHEAHPTR